MKGVSGYSVELDVDDGNGDVDPADIEGEVADSAKNPVVDSQ
jgi:hypothetical protein